MARVYQTGFETNHVPYYGTGNNWFFPDGLFGGTHTGLNATEKRTGTHCLQCTSSGSTSTFYLTEYTTASDLFFRFYFKWGGSIARLGEMFYFSGAGGVGSFGMVLNTDGSLRFCGPVGGATQQSTFYGNSSSPLTSGQWYCIEFYRRWNAGTSQHLVDWKIDGNMIQTNIVLPGATQSGLAACGFMNWNSSATPDGADHYYDDFSINDTTGTVNNAWCDDGKVVLLVPTADNQDGSWTLASGGNTNLYGGVDNVPPTCMAASDGARIESVDSSGDNATDEARFDFTTYSTAGVASTDTITAIMPVVLCGEEAATGTKGISFGLYSNPSGSLRSVSDVTNGNTGAVGTYWQTFPDPTWWWFRGNIIERPSVTLGSSPVVNLRKTDTGTRSATVGAIYLYVDYSPTKTVPTLVMAPPIPTGWRD